ncbi:MAG: L-ribulose-5-phosphate 4-epimerase [Cutibacterium avidum]|uniref:L-ribulose-5-phosphate 4-epimerase n=1 Tax=Cutibacterium avidum TaxID=33010 RepID=UPI0003B7F4FC|nr:L-ribulose-5-phosphate 4-epimerase [Cutibacterium avidum]ERS23223.1 L-ribulose-5-phosphate 4-epimerase [Propionibacterium sp. KPL2005]ERS29904.1 L-ribulose-5-phosphate 4-epimerase [Propionibacterium sp. KPL2000]MCG7369985.1 L-ribulose-5-phosphate 4-epimerase [Cutibacterium avidum]MDU4920171.1 L-ribulose-5-phosphate 4-epimerase [Cutibacterium avidum]MDU7386636.1 L-ribulose-5-phosphate 4-epimerase [Cutibacterium avidum]
MLEHLKAEVCDGNLELPRHGLVTWTSGNLSARDPQTGLVVIKPSGMAYEGMTPDDMVVVDLDGKVVEGVHGPSSDTASHLYVYRRRHDIRSIIHTHSTFATAWAATGQDIPCCLTAIADEFGGPVPCGDYAQIGTEQIGEQIMRFVDQCPAVLLKKHGVFTVGTSITKAVKAAVMVEDVARTVTYAKLIGEISPLPQSEIDANHDRYTNRYGTAAASSGVTL